jgi:hypothetical protein
VADRSALDAIVVGGGVGGLATAIRLRAAGHRVTVLERNAVAGGKLAVLERDGFVFDVGPSLVTLPHVYDELFRCAGTTLADEVDLRRLDPQFGYRWRDGWSLTMRDDGCDEPGYRAFVEHGRQIWDISERTFFAGPMGSPVSLLRRMQRPSDLVRIDPLTGAVVEQLGPIGLDEVWGLATFDDALYGFTANGGAARFSFRDGGVLATPFVLLPGRRFWGAAARPGARSFRDAGPVANGSRQLGR